MNCIVSFEKFILPFGTVNPELSGDVLDDFECDLDIEESKFFEIGAHLKLELKEIISNLLNRACSMQKTHRRILSVQKNPIYHLIQHHDYNSMQTSVKFQCFGYVK
jgi:hypothetical protein